MRFALVKDKIKPRFLTKKYFWLLVLLGLVALPLVGVTAPDTPTNSSPSNGATSVSTTPTLSASAYSNPEDSATSSDGIVDRVNGDDFTGQNTESGDNQTTNKAGGVSTNAIDLDGSNEFLLKDSPSFSGDTKSGGRSFCAYFRFDTAISGNGQYVIFWVKDDSSSTYSGFWNFRVFKHSSQTSGNYRLSFQRRVENGETFSSANIINGTTNLSLNTWYLGCVTTNGSGHLFYINSTAQGSRNTSASGDWWGNTLTPVGTVYGAIGATQAGVVPFNGQIDEVTYWNKELSSGEISELYNSGTPIDPTTHSAAANLDGYWPLGEELDHAASQWQISDTSGDYSSPVYDSGTDATNLTSVTVPGGSELDGGTTYYWRVRYQDSEGDWSSWSTETSFTTISAGTLSVDIVDSGGSTVTSPSVDMDSVEFSFSDQTATGTFATSDEKIRVDNGTGTDTWTLSLAADGGATDFWDGASSDYDYNDSTANAGDGGDTDSLGGEMTVDPSGITITPEGGCTTTNISAGSSDAFDEGTTDSITLASAASGADTSCYWDITGVDISQTIPAEQPVDNYSIDMTLSIVAS